MIKTYFINNDEMNDDEMNDDIKTDDRIPVRCCPRCNKIYQDCPALSRRDNKTEICPNCGMDEALVDWDNYEILK